jgi:hypothetical protein
MASTNPARAMVLCNVALFSREKKLDFLIADASRLYTFALACRIAL